MAEEEKQSSKNQEVNTGASGNKSTEQTSEKSSDQARSSNDARREALNDRKPYVKNFTPQNFENLKAEELKLATPEMEIGQKVEKPLEERAYNEVLTADEQQKLDQKKKDDNPFDKEAEIDRDKKKKAGERIGFDSPDFSSSDGDIISFMYSELMKGVDKGVNGAINVGQWGVYLAGYGVVKGGIKLADMGHEKYSEKKDAKDAQTKHNNEFKKRFKEISEFYDADTERYNGDLEANRKFFQEKIARDLVEGELEGNFASRKDMMLYSTVVAANTVSGKTLARTMARQQMLADALKNPSEVKNEKTLAQDFNKLTQEFSEKIFHASSQMNPVEMAQFIETSMSELNGEVKDDQGNVTGYSAFTEEKGQIDVKEKALNDINKQLEDKYQKSLDAYEKVAKENPEVKEAGDKLKKDVVKTTFNSPKAKLFTNKIATERKAQKEAFEKNKEKQIGDMMSNEGCSREVATAKVQMKHNVAMAARNMAYAEMMRNSSGKTNGAYNLRDDQIKKAEKEFNKSVDKYEKKIFATIDNSVDGYKEGSITAEQRAIMKMKTLNEISTLSTHAAARAAQPENDGSAVEKNKYLTHGNQYMKEVADEAKERDFKESDKGPKSVDLVTGAKLDEESSKKIKDLADKDAGFKQKLAYIQKETGGANKTAANEQGNNFNYANYAKEGNEK